MILTGIYATVIEWIPQGSRVLDLGTGDGTFLARLIAEKNVRGEGVEINMDLVASCIEKGLTVHQGDILDGLDQYSSGSFDYIILLGTFQELVDPNYVLEEVFRVGKRLIIGYSNFAYWKSRLQIVFRGKTPITESMPHPWYKSPNIQYFSIRDFHDFCAYQNIVIVKEACFSNDRLVKIWPNLFADQAVAMLEKT
jgi:methionine biosynthesis protein MetW